jgi:predicted phage-related endonuclease
MKSKLILHPTGTMNQEDWLRFRDRGVGASDVGTILGLNPYKCSGQLFREKVEGAPFNLENLAQFMGKYQEPYIADLWQYWDPYNPGDGQMIENYRNKKIVRKCRRVNAYVQNPDYPWLFVSLDRVICKNAEVSGGRTVIIDGGGVLELKTIAGYEAKKWEGGTPPAYVVQVQTQQLVTEMFYGEMAIMEDGRAFDVLPFEYNPGICETIIKKTREFWDKVEEGRKIYNRLYNARLNFNYAEADRLEQELTNVEPPPEGTEAWAKYLKERYKIAEPGEMKGTDDLLEKAQRHKQLTKEIEKLEAEKLKAENEIKNAIRDGATKLDFATHGHISWKPDARGARPFRNNLKTA